MKAARSLAILLAIAVCVALPPYLPRHFVDLLVFAGIYTIAGLGVGLLLGQCGIANLGQIVFYAIGATQPPISPCMFTRRQRLDLSSG
jgi:branched-chain amino acid transport system permease protein